MISSPEADDIPQQVADDIHGGAVIRRVELAESDRLRDKYIKEADEIAAVYAEWKREADKYDYDVFLSFKDEDKAREIGKKRV